MRDQIANQLTNTSKKDFSDKFMGPTNITSKSKFVNESQVKLH